MANAWSEFRIKFGQNGLDKNREIRGPAKAPSEGLARAWLGSQAAAFGREIHLYLQPFAMKMALELFFLIFYIF